MLSLKLEHFVPNYVPDALEGPKKSKTPCCMDYGGTTPNSLNRPEIDCLQQIHKFFFERSDQ